MPTRRKTTEDAIQRASVPSPGGWEAPAGTRPGWSWVPTRYGVRPSPEPMPWWLRVWSRVPLIDRFADEWMWFHGRYLVVPPEHPLLKTYGPAEYEALTGMPRAEYERQLVEFARESFREVLPSGLILESVGIRDARLVVLFRLPDVPARRFGWDSTVWPSPHPDDYAGTPEWGDAVATFVDAAVEERAPKTEAPDEDGVIWLSPRA